MLDLKGFSIDQESQGDLAEFVLVSRDGKLVKDRDLTDLVEDEVIAAGRRAGREYGVVIDTDAGVAFRVSKGGRNSVTTSQAATNIAYDAYRRGDRTGLVNHHFHPDDVPLSDLDILAAVPGFAGIVAHTSSGSHYAAFLGSKTSKLARNVVPLWKRAFAETRARARDMVNIRSYDEVAQHAALMALDAAGLITYAWRLSDRDARLYREDRKVLREVYEALLPIAKQIGD